MKNTGCTRQKNKTNGWNIKIILEEELFLLLQIRFKIVRFEVLLAQNVEACCLGRELA